MDAARQANDHTIDEIYNLPDGQRAELIDGELYIMAAPGTKHQRLVMALSNSIYNYIRQRGGACEVFPAPFAVFLNADNEIYVEPDVSVVCDKSKLTDKGCDGAPDWIIEVVSPSSRAMDYYRKLISYQKAGVREYWIADPEKKRVIVYDFAHEEVYDYAFSDKVKSMIFNDFAIDFSQINME